MRTKPAVPCDDCKNNPSDFSRCGNGHDLCLHFPFNSVTGMFAEKKTNMNVIQEMSSVELANFLYWADGRGYTNKQWLDWLREEHE